MSSAQNISDNFNKTALDVTSLTVLELQLPASISYIILGLVGVVGNCVLFYVIIRNKSLRSSFYLNLFHVAFADSLFCLFSLMIGIDRLIHYVTQQPQTNTPVNCAYLLAPWFAFKNASPAQAVCVAADRFLCVAFPTRYEKLDVRYHQIGNLALWLICITVISYASTLYNPEMLVPTCTSGQVYTVEFNTISSSFGITMDLTTTLSYSLLLVTLLYRLKKGQRQGKNMKELKKSLQYRAALTSFMLFFVYTFVSLSGELHQIITSTLDPITKSKQQPYSMTIMLVGCDLAFVICVARNHDIKEAVRKLICCEHNLATWVYPFTGSSAIPTVAAANPK